MKITITPEMIARARRGDSNACPVAQYWKRQPGVRDASVTAYDSLVRYVDDTVVVGCFNHAAPLEHMIRAYDNGDEFLPGEYDVS